MNRDSSFRGEVGHQARVGHRTALQLRGAAHTAGSTRGLVNPSGTGGTPIGVWSSWMSWTFDRVSRQRSPQPFQTSRLQRQRKISRSARSRIRSPSWTGTSWRGGPSVDGADTRSRSWTATARRSSPNASGRCTSMPRLLPRSHVADCSWSCRHPVGVSDDMRSGGTCGSSASTSRFLWAQAGPARRFGSSTVSSVVTVRGRPSPHTRSDAGRSCWATTVRTWRAPPRSCAGRQLPSRPWDSVRSRSIPRPRRQQEGTDAGATCRGPGGARGSAHRAARRSTAAARPRRRHQPGWPARRGSSTTAASRRRRGRRSPPRSGVARRS